MAREVTFTGGYADHNIRQKHAVHGQLTRAAIWLEFLRLYVSIFAADSEYRSCSHIWIQRRDLEQHLLIFPATIIMGRSAVRRRRRRESLAAR